MVMVLCGATISGTLSKIAKNAKNGNMHFFDVFQDSHENGCGAIWRYVALSTMAKNNTKNGKTAMF